MSTSSTKCQNRRFHVVVVQWTSKKCTKKRDARAELLFWSLNLLLFWSRRCGRRRNCLSSLMTSTDTDWLINHDAPRLVGFEQQWLVLSSAGSRPWDKGWEARLPRAPPLDPPLLSLHLSAVVCRTALRICVSWPWASMLLEFIYHCRLLCC